VTPDERSEVESRAERSLRRGELSEAFKLVTELTRAFPADRHLADRLAQLKDNIDPAELLNPKSNLRAEPEGPPRTPVDEAEQRAARGDYAGAIALYRRLLAERPDSDLLRERLDELFHLATAQNPHRELRAPTPEALLNELLQRIASRNRAKRR
jgi:hypothetical protein